MPNNGTYGTPTRPDAPYLEQLNLSDATVSSLVGLGFDTFETQNGAVIVFSGFVGDFSEAVAAVDGTTHPVTDVIWYDETGTRRPVTEWHLGPKGSRIELPNGTIVELQVEEDWVGEEFKLPTFVDNLQVEEDWVGEEFKLPTFVDNLQVEEDWVGKTFN